MNKLIVRILKNILFVFLFALFMQELIAQPEFSKLNSMPGSFSRMGFGARGMAMGNAMSAVVKGNLVSYYNPATSAFQKDNYFNASYSFLSLDRNLNFLNYTRNFEFRKKKGSLNKKGSVAGISIGLINSGVSDIDGRDNQGNSTGSLSTSENQFFLGLANRFSEKVSVGIAVKFYYYSLYKEISATGFAIDLGAIYLYNPNLSFAFTVSDINAKYKWDTGQLYGTEGTTTTDKFPLLIKFGASYFFDNLDLLVNTEIEHSNAETDFIRLGAEYTIFNQFNLRAGIDRISISNPDIPIKPAFGFSYVKAVSMFNLGINYAFVIEPYSSSDQHVLGIEVLF